MSSITPIPFPFYNSLGIAQRDFFENKVDDNDLLPQYVSFIDEDEKCSSQNCNLEKLKKNVHKSAASTIKKTENDDDENEKYGGFYTQLYIASLSVVGLFVVYRLMKK
jgi:hypothetical protein